MPSIWAVFLFIVADATDIPSLSQEACGISLLQLRVEPHRAAPRALDSVVKNYGEHAQLLSASDPGHYVSAAGGDVSAWGSAQSRREKDFEVATPPDAEVAAPPSAQSAEAPKQAFAAQEHPVAEAVPAPHPAAGPEHREGAGGNPFDTEVAKPIAPSEQAFAAQEHLVAAPEPEIRPEGKPKREKSAATNPFDAAAAKPIAASKQTLAAGDHAIAAADKAPQPEVGQAHHKGSLANPFDTAAAKPVAASEQALSAQEHQAPDPEPELRSAAPTKHLKDKQTPTAENPFDTPAAKPIVASTPPVASSSVAPDVGVLKAKIASEEQFGTAEEFPDLASPAANAASPPAATPVSKGAASVPEAPPASTNAAQTSENAASRAGSSSSQKSPPIDPMDPFSGWLYAKDGTRTEGTSAEANGISAEPSVPAFDHASEQAMGMGKMGMGQQAMGMGQQAMGMGKQAMGMGEQSVGAVHQRMGMGKGDIGAGYQIMGMGKGAKKQPPKSDNAWHKPKVPHVRGLDGRGDGDVSVFTGEPGSFVDLQDFPGKVGGPDGFSVAFDAAWLELGEWTSVIDFGSGDGQDNIVVSNTEDTNGLSFHIYRHGHVSTLDVKNAIHLRTVNRYLCSVSKHGEMKIYKDGKVIGHRKRGNVPAAVKREHLLIGKSNWKGGGSSFKGTVSDLCVWNKQVSWKDAADCITTSSSSLVYAAHYLPGIMASNPGAK